MSKEWKWRLVWIIVTILFGISMIISNCGGRKVTKVNSSIPPPDPNLEPRVYDFYQDRWVYKDEIEPRAKDIYIEKHENSLDEDDIQEYLEDHLDGYKEDTYWGEEWDEPNKDF